jgi:hypothetical protein
MGTGKRTTIASKKMLAHLAWISFVVSGCLESALPVAAQQSVLDQKQSSVTQLQSSELPDSPGAIVAQAQAPAAPQSTQSPPSTSQDSTSQEMTAPQRPVGTAAAEAPSTSGVAASEPAGVAIAPAKQRRARTIIIRTGAIIGAAVAVGVVVALSAGTSSKPPGAH